MDRFSVNGSGKKLIYQEALEFIGEARAGISWERFSMQAVRYSEALIDMLSGAAEAENFLSLKGISREYVNTNIRGILSRLHFNRENDHYLTLSLSRDASDAQINKRWKDLMLIYHPDRSSDEDAAECAKRINEAYNVLKYPDKKREYDMKMMTHGEAYSGTSRRRKVHAERSHRYLFISPQMRRLIPKLIIPCCIVISSVMLLIIFLNNRQEPPFPQASAPLEKKKFFDGKTHMPTIPKDEDSQGIQETISFDDVRKFYREETEPQSSDDNVPKKQSAVYKSLKGTGVPAPQRAVEDGPKMDLLTSAPKRDALQRMSFVSAGDAKPLEPVAKNSERQAEDGGTQRSYPPARDNGASGQAPKSAADNPLPNERHDDSDTEVFFFLVQYINAYEQGDISKFMTFFSRSATESNMRYDDVRAAYSKHFENSKYSFVLKNVSIQRKDNAIVVTGDYSIKRLTGRERGPAINGKARWILNREDGSLKITKVDYDRS